MKNALESVLTSPKGDLKFLMSGEIRPTEGHLSWVSFGDGERKLCLLRKRESAKIPISHTIPPAAAVGA